MSAGPAPAGTERAGAPYFSVVVPTRGEPAKLLLLLEALARQTFPRDRFEVLLSFDAASPGGDVRERVYSIGARTVESPGRRGPGAARNRGAAAARGTYLAFTEDDCVPDTSWLERAASRLTREPSLDVLEGETLRPDGRATRRPDPTHPHYLPTNLFVRRTLFERLGGYSEDFFDARRAIYFREDSDFGFRLEETAARITREPAARVVHPVEHPGYLDPLRWARRYRMDALLRARHPQRFHDRIEVHRIGPFTFRRLFVRACYAYVIALAAAGIAAIAGEPGLAAAFLFIAAAAFLPIWAKWGFYPLRIPVVAVVPLVLVLSHARGARIELHSRGSRAR